VLKKLFSFRFLALLLFFIFLYSCDFKSGSVGDFDQIIVFSDSVLYTEIESKLNRIFDNFIYTPHSEKSFLHKWIPLNLIDSYKKRRNIILIGLLNQNDPTSEYVKKMLSPEIQKEIEKGEIFEIFKENIFAYDQLGLIICAANRQQLNEKLLQQSESIYNNFKKYHFWRLKRILFSGNEQFDIENFLTNEYGWTVKVPYSYQIVERSIDSNFVWIKRTEPSRSLFVYRTLGNKSKIQENWIQNIRDSLATVHFDGDSISVEDTYTLQTVINGIPATKMVGIWQNHQQILGGPFRTYAIHDENSGYIYIIDISVVAPGKRKKPFIDQLEVIANTFRIISN
jgi:hypothetical protein